MKHFITRRTTLFGSAIWASGLGLSANLTAMSPAQSGILGRDTNEFDVIFRESSGAVAASFSDFAVRSPEGITCSARLAYPLVFNKRLPVLIFIPDEGASASHYDPLTGALAAQDYFVISIDRRRVNGQTNRPSLSVDQLAEHRLRHFAEARFLLDTIDAAAAVLGTQSDLVDASRVGTMGHGEGAWIAAGLGGWDSNGSPSTRTRDGRVYAILGLLPTRSLSPTQVAPQRSPGGVNGLFVGDLTQMPIAQEKSGLLGLGLPVNSTSFGGLIGVPTDGETKRANAEPQALAAAIASAVLFFDWTLRGNQDRKRELMNLDGRQIDGLSTPLQLRRT